MALDCTVSRVIQKRQLDKFLELAPIYLVMRGDAQAAEALKSIEDPDRRMAALWNYARYPKNKNQSIAAGWVWSDQQIAAYKTSPEKRGADIAIQNVAQLFNSDKEMRAKGAGQAVYSLHGDTDPRPFKVQMANWLRSDAHSVVNYGRGLYEHLLKEMNRCDFYPIFTDPLSVHDLMKFGKMIENYMDASKMGLKSPMFATPGLSDHGQSHAIDFKVFKTENGKPTQFLGTDSGLADNWRKEGCAAALARAVGVFNGRSGRKVFDGPLTNPDEPWHWVYHPAPMPRT
jgi:hypothetical protein